MAEARLREISPTALVLLEALLGEDARHALELLIRLRRIIPRVVQGTGPSSEDPAVPGEVCAALARSLREVTAGFPEELGDAIEEIVDAVETALDRFAAEGVLEVDVEDGAGAEALGSVFEAGPFDIRAQRDASVPCVEGPSAPR